MIFFDDDDTVVIMEGDGTATASQTLAVSSERASWQVIMGSQTGQSHEDLTISRSNMAGVHDAQGMDRARGESVQQSSHCNEHVAGDESMLHAFEVVRNGHKDRTDSESGQTDAVAHRSNSHVVDGSRTHRPDEEQAHKRRGRAKDASKRDRRKGVKHVPSLDDRLPDGRRIWPECFTSSMCLDVGVLAQVQCFSLILVCAILYNPNAGLSIIRFLVLCFRCELW
jgi:hypothetical protein